MSVTAERKATYTKLIKGAIMLAIMIGISSAPAPAPLTQDGMTILGVFLGVLFGWIFIDVGAGSLVAVIMLYFLNYNDMPMSDIISGILGGQMAVMIFGVLLLAAHIAQTGIGEAVVMRLLKCKVVYGRPFLFLFFFMLGSFIMSIASSTIAAILLLLPLFAKVNEVAGFEFNSKQVHAFFIGIIYGGMYGNVVLPVKSMCAVFFNGELSSQMQHYRIKNFKRG